jgi:hypothetical protein
MVWRELYCLMRPSVGVAVACAFLVVLSACFLFVAYALAKEVSGIDLSEDAFFVIESIIFTGVAVWGMATAIGVWRLRRWGRISALWLSCAVCLVYLPEVVRYAYLVKTAPDVGWSWKALYPLVPLFAVGIWWLIFFTRPRTREQFCQQPNTVGPAR